MSEHWIQKAIKHPGALHHFFNVPEGQKIPQSKLEAHKNDPGKVGKQVRMAITMKKFHGG